MKSAPDLILIDDLDRNILKLCTHINAATYELLVIIREFDERAGFVQLGAREKVRVARALKVLPGVSAASSTGELSYSKVRSLTRVIRPDNEDELTADTGPG